MQHGGPTDILSPAARLRNEEQVHFLVHYNLSQMTLPPFLIPVPPSLWGVAIAVFIDPAGVVLF